MRLCVSVERSDRAVPTGGCRCCPDPCCLCHVFQATASSGRARSFSLLPHPPLSSSASSSSASPAGSRATPLAGAPSGIVTITHHKSPAAARRAHSQYPGRLLEVKEVRNRTRVVAEGGSVCAIYLCAALPVPGVPYLFMCTCVPSRLSFPPPVSSVPPPVSCHGDAAQIREFSIGTGPPTRLGSGGRLSCASQGSSAPLFSIAGSLGLWSPSV